MVVSVILMLTTLAVTNNAQENDFGFIGTCERPNLRYCDRIIDHEVPASIARQSQFVEISIRLWVEYIEFMEENPTCGVGLKKALCKQRFPECSELHNVVMFEAHSTCEADLQNCSINNNIVNEICSSVNTSLYLGTSQPLDQHSKCVGRYLERCNQQSRRTMMTDWMFRFLSLTDTQLGADTSSLLQQYGDCYNKYVQYRCDMGHSEGHHVISSNTQESCYNSVLGW